MDSRSLIPIVTELRNIVNGIQYIIDNGNNTPTPNNAPIVLEQRKNFGNECPFSVNDPRNPSYRDPRSKSKYTNKCTDKYNRNKDPTQPRAPRPPKPVKPPKAPKPPKIKEFVCYGEGCDQRFGQWKDARMHLKEVHNIEKAKYKRSKVSNTPTNNNQAGRIPTQPPPVPCDASVVEDNFKLASNTVSPQPTPEKEGEAVAADCC